MANYKKQYEESKLLRGPEPRETLKTGDPDWHRHQARDIVDFDAAVARSASVVSITTTITALSEPKYATSLMLGGM